MKLVRKPNNCQQFVCECIPKEECEELGLTELIPSDVGMVKELDLSGCCPVVVEKCKPELCSKPETCSAFSSLKKSQNEDACCPEYECVPPENKCIVELKHIANEDGGERLRNEFEIEKVLKDVISFKLLYIYI